MALRTITLSIDPTLSYVSVREPAADTACGFCGASAGLWIGGSHFASGHRDFVAACALCNLPLHLERPHIDQEAALVWLPEISQPALSAILRELHISLQALGEDVHADAVFRTRAPVLSNLFYARAILADRRRAAEVRVGTASPRELGLALLEISPAAYDRRGELLGGLRLLPLGRIFEGDQDVYPEIVAFWRSRPASTATI